MSSGMRGTRRREALQRGAALLGVGAVGVACAPGGAGGGDRIAQGQSTREVTLRWSTWGDSQNTFNSVGAPQGVKLFNEKFPRIKVEIEPQIAPAGRSRTTPSGSPAPGRTSPGTAATGGPSGPATGSCGTWSRG